MTPEQFKIYWNLTYPGSVPISYLFRHYFHDRWFRIHSLPGSKRYAETPEEWDILLDRQNKIISDLLNGNKNIIIVSGDYSTEEEASAFPIEDLDSISKLKFTPLPAINLHKVIPGEFEKGQIYNPFFTEQTWEENKFDDILTDIAGDQLRAFFLSVENKCIIAPYDGGIDIILKDSITRDKYKLKYKDWLSERPDEL